jgi:hypothetical protein
MRFDHISGRVSPNIPELWKDEGKYFTNVLHESCFFSVPNDSRMQAEIMGLKLRCCRRVILFLCRRKGAFVPCLLRKAGSNMPANPYVRHAVARRTFFDQNDAEDNTMPKRKWLYSC